MRFVLPQLVCLLSSVSHAFMLAPYGVIRLHALKQPINIDDSFETSLAAEKTTKKSTSSLDPAVRAKLVTESIAPFRSLRIYFYIALGAGASIGGLITLAGVFAALSGVRSDLDLNVEYKNLAIDFGAAAFFAVCWKLDSDKSAELSEQVEQKIDRRKEQAKRAKAMRDREDKLKDLSLNIQISVDGTTQEAKVGALQAGAKQHMIIVVGPKKACRDALIGANLMKNDFALSNVLVVPYDTAIGVPSETPLGFGEQPTYATQPFIARPMGAGWEEYVKAEMDDAVAQSGEKCKEQGIAIVVKNTGQVIRRGVGTVPWRQMVDELIGKENEDLPLI